MPNPLTMLHILHDCYTSIGFYFHGHSQISAPIEQQKFLLPSLLNLGFSSQLSVPMIWHPVGVEVECILCLAMALLHIVFKEILCQL